MRKSFQALTAALILATGFGTLPAHASAIQTNQAPTVSTSTGLIVRYQPGVSRIAPDGSTTGENAAGVALAKARALGGGLFALDFETTLTDAQSAIALDGIKRDPRISTAQLDQKLSYDLASIPVRKLSISEVAQNVSWFRPLTVQRGASAVGSVRVSNALASNAQRQVRVKLSWTAPTSLFGARVVGYRIEAKRATSKTWTVSISNTASTKLSAYANKGITFGVLTDFRVRAITKSSAGIAIGAPSTSRQLVAKVAPLAPELTTANVVFDGETVIWQKQSINQRGGDAVKYTVTATDPRGISQSCVTTASSCLFDALESNIPYTVQVKAQNSVGSGTTLKVSDSLYGTQWHLYSQYSVHADKAWNISQGSNSVVVAVLDSGITSHPDLDSKVLPGYDFISDAQSARDGDGWDANPLDQGDWDSRYDSSWHGTHVAGIIAASANSTGVRGVAPNVSLLPVRVLGTTGGETSDLIAAIHWATGLDVAGVPKNLNPAKVINLSIGTNSTSGCDAGTKAAVRAAWDAGATPVTAAGNASFEAARSYPGNCYPTINVAATAVNGDIASYSNYGDGVDFSAPGGDSTLSDEAVDGSDGMVLSTWNHGTTVPGEPDYGLEEGTSMAAPVVSGVVALIYSLRPDFSSDDVYKVILKSVQAFKPDTGCAATAANYVADNAVSLCGAGIVDAGAALKLAKTY
ncbi:MAG: S8 family serine peptidase, partial [Microbacteriaceae bacterium]